jgi:hypothetical protein
LQPVLKEWLVGQEVQPEQLPEPLQPEVEVELLQEQPVGELAQLVPPRAQVSRLRVLQLEWVILLQVRQALVVLSLLELPVPG